MRIAGLVHSRDMPFFFFNSVTYTEGGVLYFHYAL